MPDDIDITFNLYDTYGDGLTSGAGNGEFQLYVCGAQVFQALRLNIYLEHSQVVMAPKLLFLDVWMKLQLISLQMLIPMMAHEYEVVLGCTDEEAVNYNEEATDDDGSYLFT